jgi:hypothetical protein
MSSAGVLVFLVAFALVAGLMEGVSGEGSGSFVRRRLAERPLAANAVVTPASYCPITCGGPFNPAFPNCCRNIFIPGWDPFYFCSNNQIDILNCGRCGRNCITSRGFAPGVACCGGSCTNLQSDNKNCGFCGNRCRTNKGDVCRGGLCGYSG